MPPFFFRLIGGWNTAYLWKEKKWQGVLAFETCFLQLTIITVENEGKIALDSQKRICFYAKEPSDPDIYREFKTSVLRSIKVFRYLTPVIEHLKPIVRKRGKELQECLRRISMPWAVALFCRGTQRRNQEAGEKRFSLCLWGKPPQ